MGHYGIDSEEVRRLTIDPLVKLSGTPSSLPLLNHARHAVASRRKTMIVAHEQALLLIQHLVVLEGGEGNECPGDSEIALWLACAGEFLGRWKESGPPISTQEEVIASLSQASRFNNDFDKARTLVRSRQLFSSGPSQGELAELDAWQALVEDAFDGPYDRFFESCLGAMFILSSVWGDDSGDFPNPVVHVPNFLAQSSVPVEQFVDMLRPMASTRDELRTIIRGRLKDGLPHAPTALLYQPFVEVEPMVFVAISPMPTSIGCCRPREAATAKPCARRYKGVLPFGRDGLKSRRAGNPGRVSRANEHNTKMPHPAFGGQTPDETFFATGSNLPEDLALAKSNARAARLAANRAASCERCLEQEAYPPEGALSP